MLFASLQSLADDDELLLPVGFNNEYTDMASTCNNTWSVGDSSQPVNSVSQCDLLKELLLCASLSVLVLGIENSFYNHTLVNLPSANQ